MNTYLTHCGNLHTQQIVAECRCLPDTTPEILSATLGLRRGKVSFLQRCVSHTESYHEVDSVVLNKCEHGDVRNWS